MPRQLSTPLNRLRNPEWIDVLAIAAWGILMLKYWLSGRLGLLIHPNYFWLAIGSGILLLFLALAQGIKLWQNPQTATIRHITLFPPGWMSALLLTAALIGLLITPRPFSSQTALQRGLADNFTVTRNRPQSFRVNMRSEDRTLVDWIRTLDVYPEPDAYQGQKAKVQGFVVHTPGLPDNYLTITRFVITCCAADAYPIGLPVKLAVNRQTYPQDQWFEVQGQMITETLGDKRQVVIQASSLRPIAEPAKPFAY